MALELTRDHRVEAEAGTQCCAHVRTRPGVEASPELLWVLNCISVLWC